MLLEQDLKATGYARLGYDTATAAVDGHCRGALPPRRGSDPTNKNVVPRNVGGHKRMLIQQRGCGRPMGRLLLQAAARGHGVRKAQQERNKGGTAWKEHKQRTR